jgi:hypothetical protein
MIKGSDVLTMLLPNGGWAIIGNNYEDIQFLECDPISKAEYESGFTTYENWKLEKDELDRQTAEQESAGKDEAKQAVLAKLGLTADEVAALLG